MSQLVPVTAFEAKGEYTFARAVGLRLSQTNATKVQISDSEIRDCLLDNADLTDASIVRTRVVGARLTGINGSKFYCKDVEFRDCKIDLANFKFSRFRSVVFQDCVLDNTEFQSAQLQDVRFRNCSMAGTGLGGAALKNVDLRTSKIEEIDGLMGLKGAIIDTTQLIALAPVLAAEAGLIVRED